MGVKCQIVMKISSGVEFITVSNNGDFENVGKTLLETFKNYKIIQMLMNRGDIVKLGNNLRTMTNDNPEGTLDYRQACNVKGIDIDKARVKARKLNDISDLVSEKTDVEYIYYFIKNKWYGMFVNKDDEDDELKPYLSKFEPLENLIA